MVSFPTWPKFECVEGALAVGTGIAALAGPARPPARGEGDAPARWFRVSGMNGRPGPGSPPLTDEDAVLEGEGRGALLASEAAHGVRDAPPPLPPLPPLPSYTTTQPRPGAAVPRRKPAPAHHELAPLVTGGVPLTRGDRLASCPAPPTRAGALCPTRLLTPRPQVRPYPTPGS